MRLAVVGSRSIDDEVFVLTMMKAVAGDEDIKTLTIISGGARGIDQTAQSICNKYGIDFILFKPYHLIDNSVEYTPRHFFTRNKQIVDNADKVLVLWDGKSKGSEHVIKYATKRNKDLTVINYNNKEEEIDR